MPKEYPLWCRADSIECALEVAHELCILAPSETPANHICTIRHIGAIVELAMVAVRDLAKELEEPPPAAD